MSEDVLVFSGFSDQNRYKYLEKFVVISTLQMKISVYILKIIKAGEVLIWWREN